MNLLELWKKLGWILFLWMNFVINSDKTWVSFIKFDIILQGFILKNSSSQNVYWKLSVLL